MHIQQYITNINALFITGNSSEHSYRGDLQQLLTSLLNDVLVTNEPKRIACGAPDYILTRKDVPIGYIEAKDVGAELGSKLYKEQFDRYKAALDNLIITDYLQFHFYKHGELQHQVSIAALIHGKMHAQPENFAHFTALIENFALQITQSIKSPTKLAHMMAAKAKLMAQVIESALNEDDSKQRTSDLQGQMAAFKNILIHDIDNKGFADIYAQTIAYGLFAARYHDPTLHTFSRQEAATLIPQSNPFLRKLFQYIAGYELDSRLVWLVDELVQIFLASDVASIMHNFGKSTRQQDPIVHFYETFLAEYDAKLRKARGVWYTPEPVVNFIVRAVDDILKAHFNLPQGLADTSKTKVQIETIAPGSKGKPIKQEKELHRVQILDPATGTGTFLAQTIRHIYQHNFASMQGAWPAYVKAHLIPRLNGFELLMTSYAMAHLKLDMLLTETGYTTSGDTERLHVYLTNSLEEYHPDTGTLFANWLSSEANEANYIKRDAPVMVVLGNPPYSGHSSNKSKWIETLLETYKQEPSGGKLKEKNPKWLNDDYVKFIRYGQYYVEKNGEGVLAFITNNGYLDNPTFRGMRWSLMQSFDEIYLIDLHGNAKKKEVAPDGGKDENVFDIMQGVAIVIMVKTGQKSKGTLANIWHGDVFGKRDFKYQRLSENTLHGLAANKLNPSSTQFAWVKRDDRLVEQYQQGFGVQELFSLNSVGVVSSRDDLVIDFDADKLSSRMQKFFSSNAQEVKLSLGVKETKSWAISNVQKLTSFSDKFIVPITYRPLDRRYLYNDPKFIERSRNVVMQHFTKGSNLGLNWIRPMSSNYDFDIFISKHITDQCSAGNKSAGAGISYLAPLYLYPESVDEDLLRENARTPNLNMPMVDTLAQGLGLTFTPEKSANPVIPAEAGIQTGFTGTGGSEGANTDIRLDSRLRGNDHQVFAPIDLFDYIYAVLHSPSYRATYKTFLNTDFPRVPYPTDAAKFWQLVALGGEMRQLHLMEGAAFAKLTTRYPISGSHMVDKPSFKEGRVYINDSQYFEDVPPLAWAFYIGGYQPAQKWLKDRKGRTLSFEDILHYQKIIHALVETDRLMHDIDRVGVV